MLEKLVLKNFQCHEKEVIDLGQITTICGPSDKGKTAFLRALRWLVHNRPSGEAFVRHGESLCSVRLRFDGGKSIVRKKGKGCNEYKFGDRNYRAFGTEVPGDIEAVLNIGEENYASQHSPAFWFHLSPGEVSKRLNAIVNLDLIDKTLANLASESRKAKTTIEVIEGRLGVARLKRKHLVWAEDADKALAQVEKSLNVLNSIREKRVVVASAIEKLKSIEDASQLCLGAASAMESVVEAGNRVIETRERVKSLRKSLDSLESAENTAIRARNEAKEIEARLKKEIGTECPLCGK